MSKSSSSLTPQDPKEAAPDRLRAVVEANTRTPDPDTAIGAQFAFWNRIRPIFAENTESRGLKALDDLALAVMADDPALPVLLSKPVILLPPSDVQKPGQPPAHILFQPPPVPGRASKRPVTRSSAHTKPKSTKKQKTSVKSVAKRPTLEFELPDGVPDRIKKDLSGLVKTAASLGKAPFRVAYPWCGQRVWYTPKEHKELHFAHYRFWMKFRRTFFDCALYAPTDKSDVRRKHKTQANQARLKFVSDNIETFGYYEFMRRFEDEIHDNLMWFGGKAAKHSADAKNNHAPPQEDLVTLCRRDRVRYDRTISRMSDPQRVDEDGYGSIPELLERSNALDPSRSPHLRLSQRALARIVLDVRQGTPPNPYWVGNKSRGVWKTLLTDKTLRSTQIEVVKLLTKKKPVASLSEKSLKVTDKDDDDSDFEEDDEFTALPPDAPVTASTILSTKDEDEGDFSHTGVTDESEDEDKKKKSDGDSDYQPDDEDDQGDEEDEQADDEGSRLDDNDDRDDSDSKAGGSKDDASFLWNEDRPKPSPPKSPKSK